MAGLILALLAFPRDRGALLVISLGLAGSLILAAPAVGSPRGQGSASVHGPERGGLPRPDHVVIAIEENHAYTQIIGSPSAPYINSLATQGALFTASYGITHPSQPNYLDLFSGSNQGVTTDSCPHTFSTDNLGNLLINAGDTFIGYSEDLPSPGSTVCTSGAYARKHSPWVNFSNVPSASNLPYTYFPSDYSMLPTLSFVIPNLIHDMHDGTIAQGDTWLEANLDSYVQWAMTHNSLFIFTFDEDDGSSSNRIATFFVGPMVVPGQYSQNINHFNMLRTLEDMYDLPYAGVSGNYSPITGVWSGGVATPTATHSLTPTNTPTSTPMWTPTSTPSATFSATPTPSLMGHVTWQGRPGQPNPLQALPITLTLRSGAAMVDYPQQTTSDSGLFTVTVGGLPQGLYNWRVKGPKYLANAGTVTIGPGQSSTEMDLMRVGDSNNDNVVNGVDFIVLKQTFGASCGNPVYDDRADFNGDCVVNGADFTLQKANFGRAGAPPLQ